MDSLRLESCQCLLPTVLGDNVIMWTLSAVWLNIFVVFKDVGPLIMCVLGISSLRLKNVSSLMCCSWVGLGVLWVTRLAGQTDLLAEKSHQPHCLKSF